MTAPRWSRNDTGHMARQADKHTKRERRHRKNPCGHSPHAPNNLFGEFFKATGHRRHNKWHARLRWNEVKTDIDGLPVLVRTYKVVVVYSATATEDYSPETADDWFVHQRFSVNGRDDDVDPNNTDTLKVVRGIDGKLAYAYKVKAIEVNGCPSEYSYYTIGVPNDVPPAPSDVKILRTSHGIKLRWRVPPEPTDDDLFTKDVAHFLAELWTNEDFGPTLAFTATNAGDEFTSTAHGFANGDPVMLRNSRADEGDANSDSQNDLPDGALPWKLYYVADAATDTFTLQREEDGAAIVLTSDGSGSVMWGEVRHARHAHQHHHTFRVDADDFDEDVHFYGRVCSVSSDGSKSAFIPATAPISNDDPDATPTGRRPAWHRRVLTFNPTGDLVEGAVSARIIKLDDDYTFHRVIGATDPDNPASGGHTVIDVEVREVAGSYTSIFASAADMLKFADGDDTCSTNAIETRQHERGAHMRIRVEAITGAPPPGDGVTVSIVADRTKVGV